MRILFIAFLRLAAENQPPGYYAPRSVPGNRIAAPCKAF
jgi:hypothetical protein